MGDPKRFDEFAKVIKQHLAPEMKIADIAAGKGYLRASLIGLGFDINNIESWDKRKQMSKGRKGLIWGYFDHKTAPKHYDAVVAMHPDEGTDHSLLYALENKIPALICPCCIKPSALLFNQAHKYELWCNHLENLALDKGFSVTWIDLPIVGRNKVMYIHP